jgi:adenosylhomocysteine nucleosidase
LRVLVTFALEREFAPWRKWRDFRPGNWGAASAFVTDIGGAEVGVLLTGVGPSGARAEVFKAAWGESAPLGFCISTGLAGALRTEYEIGQVLAARAVFSEGFGADAKGGSFESSGALISFAAECGATVVDRFYSAPHVVAKAEEKLQLGLNADAVEMESFQILREARAVGIPAVAIRAVSDSADEDLPIEMDEIFTEEGQISLPRVLGKVALHPDSLPGLVRLGQKSKRAAVALAQFLDRYIAVIAARTKTMEDRASVTIQ